MKKALIFILALLCISSGFSANKRFDTVVVFGDSLSDNGNLYRYMWHKLPLSPPYFAGRFSNGPLWIEYLYASYFPMEYGQGLQNYAVGGAGAVLSYKENMPYTLTMELNNYLYWHTYGKKETTLYSIWIGGNNYLNGPTNVEDITDAVINATGGVIERLISYGGNKFLLPNLPDLGRVPQSRELNNQALLTLLSQKHNSKLAVKIEQLKQKYPEVLFLHFDLYSIFNFALEHPNDYGYNNVSDPCYLGSYTGWLLNYQPDEQSLWAFLQQQDGQFKPRQWDIIKNNPQLKEAAAAGYIYQLLPAKNKEEPLNCDGYVFWDRVHPTTQTHYYIAQKARDLLNDFGLEPFIAIEQPEPNGEIH